MRLQKQVDQSHSKLVKRFCIVLAVVILPGMAASSCGTVRTHYNLEQPTGRALTASIGSVLFRVNMRGDLPNAFGKADLFGGKVDKGYAEVRLKAIDERGVLSLEVREVNLDSNETTMDRYGNKPYVAVGVSTAVTTVPGDNPNSTVLEMDLTKQTDLVIAGVKITFLEQSAYSVRYVLEKSNSEH